MSAVDRLAAARAEIARRRQVTSGSLTILDDDDMLKGTPWHRQDEVLRQLRTSWNRAEHIAANDPAHVLAVLDAAQATLDRHAPAGDDWRAYYCGGDHPRDWNGDPDSEWPCPDAAAVLDLYAPGGAR